jgi:uncharacterized phage infection (PIP) family protein YhgE
MVYGIKVEKIDAKKNEDEVIQMIRLLEKIEKAISGDGETTLVTQVQKLRTSNADKLDNLNNSFIEFAERVVADSTQSLVDALTQVMRDFNTIISTQFGENFQHLNEAVGRMLDWQKEYGSRVEAMTAQFQSVLDNTIKYSNELKNINEDIKNATIHYRDVAKNLQQLLDNLKTDINEINEVAENAQNALPVVKREIETLTNNFASLVTIAVRENNRMIENQRQNINNIINTLANEYSQMEERQRALNGQIEQITKENVEKFTRQLAEFDTQLASEMTNVMSLFSSHLTTLSGKFVEDYTPLTGRLRELIQIANRV